MGKSIKERFCANIREVIEGNYTSFPDGIEEHHNLRKDYGADSLDTTELTMEVEDEFDITCPEPEVYQLETVGAWLSYIEKKVAEKTRKH